MPSLKLTVTAAARRAATRLRLMRAQAPRCEFGADLHVGSRCRFWATEFIEIGDHCFMGREVHVETNVRIGRYVLIASRVGFVGRRDHDFRTIGVPVRFGAWIGSETHPSPYRHDAVVVEDDTWIGFGAILLSGVTVGRGSVVASGSVVTSDVPPYAIVAGNPAKVVRMRFSDPADIERHERQMRTGRFRFSEKGCDHWTVEPGPA